MKIGKGRGGSQNQQLNVGKPSKNQNKKNM